MKKSSSQYFLIQESPLSISEKSLAIFIEASRFDPRLMEVVSEFIRDFWWNINPENLNKACKKQKSPYVLRGILSAIWDHCDSDLVTRKDFSQWAKSATRSIDKASPQLVYIGLYPISSKMMTQVCENPEPSFFKHGLILGDLPFNKGIPGTIKSKTNLPLNKVSSLDLIKIEMANKVKKLKAEKRMSNSDLCKKTGINRVYMSKILNNDIKDISAEYIERVTQNL